MNRKRYFFIKFLFRKIFFDFGGGVPGGYFPIFDEYGGDGIFFGTSEPFFFPHKEEGFGEEIGAFGGGGDGGYREEVKGECIGMFGMDEVVEVFSSGRCPLSSRDAGGGDSLVGDFDEEGFCGDIFDIDLPQLSFAIGSSDDHISARVDEEVFPTVTFESLCHYIEDIPFGNAGKVHSRFESNRFAPDGEVSLEGSR